MVTSNDVDYPADRSGLELPKSPTGITGFDEVSEGGLPTGRPTLVSGPPGAGKSLFALQFLVHGATVCAEPGVFLSFEGTRGKLACDVRGLGIDLDVLEQDGRLLVDAQSMAALLLDFATHPEYRSAVKREFSGIKDLFGEYQEALKKTYRVPNVPDPK